jgi:hypothetical protein
LVQDTLNIRRYSISQEWIPGGKYEMTIDSAAIVDVYGLHNGPTRITIQVKELDDYGTIYMKILNPHENWLVQVLDKNDKVVQQQRCPTSGKVGFRYLNSGKYMFRIVVDENGNDQWDNGDYFNKIQPEELIYYPDEVNVRPNWVQDLETWDPHKFKVDEFSRQFRKPKKRE